MSLLAANLFAADPPATFSYKYGEADIKLVADGERAAVLMTTSVEDRTPVQEQRELLSGLLADIGGFEALDAKAQQEFPGLWFPSFERNSTPAEQLAAIERLNGYVGVEFAAPLLHYRKALLIPRSEIMLIFEPNTSVTALDAILQPGDLQVMRDFPALDPTYLLHFDGTPQACFARCEELMAVPGVANCQPNFIEKLEKFATPNDTLFGNQWDMNNTGQTGGTPDADMNSVAAWNISTGSSSIVIAILDEGSDVDHIDLAGNMGVGYDAVTADATPEGQPGNANQGDGHGTACAGIAAAVGNNGEGIAGICWNATLMPVRLGFGSYWTTTSWIVDALTWATDNGADVLSNSWGGGSPSSSIQNAVIYANTNGRGGIGAAVFFASGNGNTTVEYPAAYPETIAVGATSPCDERKSPSTCDGETWWGSNYGSTLDLVAPGPLVTTTDIMGSGGYTSGNYVANFNGTSSATPHAAGSAGLLLSVDPSLTYQEVRDILTSTADDQVGLPSEDTAGWDQYMGWGRINLLAALSAVGGGVDAPTNLSCNESGGDVQMSWNNGAAYDNVVVSRDGSDIATLAGSSTSYTDVGPGVGSFSYGLRGVVGATPSPSANCNVFISGGATDLVWGPSAAAGSVDGAQALADALSANGRTPLVVSTLTAAGSLSAFQAIWVNLGIYPSNHVLGVSDADLLDAYVAGGGQLYLEGGDTWAYDTQRSVHARFSLSGLTDGSGDLSTVVGLAAGVDCNASGMSFSYTGENSWIDRLGANGSAADLFENSPVSYVCGVFNDAGSYRTIGASFEFGGLANGGATRNDLMGVLLDCFFGATPTPPTASFTGSPTSGDVPLNVTFSDSSTGAIDSYSWTFGDGGSSTSANPSHTYTTAGTYSLSLTVTGPGGSDTMTRTNYITASNPPPPPIAAFSASPTSGDAPLVVAFSDASSGSITSYSWSFGDGGSSTSSNPSHTYTTAGTYTVSLTVTGPGGSDTATHTNYITVTNAPPLADFAGAPTFGVAPLVVSFTNQSSGTITNYSWNFGDGGSSTSANPSHTYTAAGTYSVSLTVSGPGGSDTLTRTNYISVAEPPPVADFTATPTSGDLPLIVDFTNASSGSISSNSWSFGDGGSSTSANPSHTYTAAGTYTVSLTVTGTGGSDTLTRTNYITVTDPSASGGLLYFSFNNGTSVPGVGTVNDEDIVSYDPDTGLWAWFFDGSDVGVATDVNAFSVLPSGEIVMSFDNPLNVGGLTADDSDLLLFTPTSLGSSTSGSFSMYFDGSDVGLTTSGEDIDGVVVADGGAILISTTGSVNVVGTTWRDEDVLLFTPTSLGSSTSGSWALYFDGSDVGMGSSGGYDLDALSLNGTNLLFSTVGSYSASGGSGDDEDISEFVGSYGGATSGSMSLLIDLTALGISSREDCDGFSHD